MDLKLLLKVAKIWDAPDKIGCPANCLTSITSNGLSVVPQT